MSIAAISFFFVCGAVAIASALITVTQNNPIRAAFSLLAHIIALAGLFIGLQGHFLAVIQLIIYAGVVVVLFIFTIMYIGPVPKPESAGRPSFAKLFSIAGMVVVTGAVTYAALGYSPALKGLNTCPEAVAECGQFGGVEAFSAALFRGGVVPFELISILLTVAVVGAIMVARGRLIYREKPRRKKQELSIENNR
ncbi:MAG: NADH-quinone oxidoreductase subunit J [Deltaproteobacteria bacterium]|nr:NADH-quinone oxidoreductase subunit J [Deltaproteobacteria bacterium]